MKRLFSKILLLLSLVALPGCLWKDKKKIQPVKIDEKIVTENNGSNIIVDDNVDGLIIDEGSSARRKSIFVDEENGDAANDSVTVDLVRDEKGDSAINSLGKPYVEEMIDSREIKLGTVHFPFNEYETLLNKDEGRAFEKIMNELTTMIKDNPNCTVVVKGHACNSYGSDRYNMQLSNYRAEMVRKKIIKKLHIKKERVSAIGYGTSQMLVYGSREDQWVNRRVEIYCLV